MLQQPPPIVEQFALLLFKNPPLIVDEFLFAVFP